MSPEEKTVIELLLIFKICFLNPVLQTIDQLLIMKAIPKTLMTKN